MTGGAVRLERQPITTGVEGKKEQKEERCATERQFVVNYSEIENDVLVDFLSLDCSLRHIQTTAGQLFSLLSLPSVCCVAQFVLTFLLDLEVICSFLCHLSLPPHPTPHPPPTSQPVSVVSLSPSWQRPADFTTTVTRVDVFSTCCC